MARKTLKEGIKAAQQPPAANPGQKIRQDIANLCTSIGDRSFVIRQAKAEIIGFHAQIDQLRDQLRALEQPNGPQAVK
jgi:hypothetical protein